MSVSFDDVSYLSRNLAQRSLQGLCVGPLEYALGTGSFVASRQRYVAIYHSIQVGTLDLFLARVTYLCAVWLPWITNGTNIGAGLSLVIFMTRPGATFSF